MLCVCCSAFCTPPSFPPYDNAAVHSNHGAFGIYSTSRFVNRRIECCFIINLYSLYGELYFTEKRDNVEVCDAYMIQRAACQT